MFDGSSVGLNITGRLKDPVFRGFERTGADQIHLAKWDAFDESVAEYVKSGALRLVSK